MNPNPVRETDVRTAAINVRCRPNIVRIQAKQEAPLKAMANGGGANAISAIARVTFYGRDQTGREVSVTGNLSITFSDWAG